MNDVDTSDARTRVVTIREHIAGIDASGVRLEIARPDDEYLVDEAEALIRERLGLVLRPVERDRPA